MKKVKVDPIPDKLLPLKNAHKIAAITFTIDMIMKNSKKYTQHLNEKEAGKVQREFDTIVEGLSAKRRKLHKPMPTAFKQ